MFVSVLIGPLVSVKLQLLGTPIHDISWSARDFIKRVPDIKHTSCIPLLSLFLERTLFPDGNSLFPPSILLSLFHPLSPSSQLNSAHLSFVLASYTADLATLLHSSSSYNPTDGYKFFAIGPSSHVFTPFPSSYSILLVIAAKRCNVGRGNKLLFAIRVWSTPELS